jgi:hypothetical protein
LRGRLVARLVSPAGDPLSIDIEINNRQGGG